MNNVACKSIFHIQTNNKKKVGISIGYLIDNNLSVVIKLVCNVSHQYFILSPQQWQILMSENDFKLIFDSLSIIKCKRGKLNNDFFYKN